MTLPARGLGAYLLQHNSRFRCCKRWRVKLRRDIKTRLSVYLPVARVQLHPSPFPSSSALHRLSSRRYTLLCFERYNLLNNERFSVRLSFGTALTDKSLDSKARQTKNQNELNKIDGLTACIIETTPPRSACHYIKAAKISGKRNWLQCAVLTLIMSTFIHFAGYLAVV